jgi:sulfur-carrier protein adenylyltransferase/sulfurtransferase
MKYGVNDHQKAVSKVRNWLKQSGHTVCAVPASDSVKEGLDYSRGWAIDVQIEDQNYSLHLLLSADFPLSVPRVALVEPKKFLEWPHVEESGLLCLDDIPVLPERPEEMARDALSQACDLILKCHNELFRQSEFRREFVSYWTKGRSNSKQQVWSLLGANCITKKVCFMPLSRSFIVAEGRDDLELWHGNRFPNASKPPVEYGLHLALPEGLLHNEIPDRAQSFFEWVRVHSQPAHAIVSEIASKQERIVILISCTTETGVGQVAIEVSIKSRTLWRGFRVGKAIPPNTAIKRWGGSDVVRRLVVRADAEWVHGRDKNPATKQLANSCVALIGVGSLGSTVAVSLAQAGVGCFVIVDYDELKTENVGRHALGVQHVGTRKVDAVRLDLLQRFPHLKGVEAFPWKVGSLREEHWSKIMQCDLVITSTGEWAADGLLCSIFERTAEFPPLIVTWLEEHATAAHALAVFKPQDKPTMQFHQDGRYSKPETRWPAEGTGTLVSEPACGGHFMPYGSIELSHASTVASELAIEVLQGKTVDPVELIYSTSVQNLIELQGEWTENHERPAGFVGSFTRRRFLNNANLIQP